MLNYDPPPHDLLFLFLLVLPRFYGRFACFNPEQQYVRRHCSRHQNHAAARVVRVDVLARQSPVRINRIHVLGQPHVLRNT